MEKDAGKPSGNQKRSLRPYNRQQSDDRINKSDKIILTIENNRSNYAEFKEYIQVKLIQDFGMNGSFIKNEECFIPPTIDMPTVPDTKLNGATRKEK